MKWIASVCCAFLVFSHVHARAPKPPAAAQFDPVRSFQEFVSEASDPKEWERVQQNSRTQRWFKSRFVIGDVKYDVRKTESLVNPIVATVSFSFEVRQSEAFETRDEAEQTVLGPAAGRGLAFRVEGSYHVDSAAWRVSELKLVDVGPASLTVPMSITYTGEELRSPKAGRFNMLEKWAR